MTRYEFKRIRYGHGDTADPAPDYVDRMARLLAAGLGPVAADMVAQHPKGGPVIIGPGIVVSMFAVRDDGVVDAEVLDA